MYLDDIVIYLDTVKEHIEHLWLIFEVLERKKLYLSKDKLCFLATELDILGHIVGNQGIWMDLAEVNTILAWKCQQTVIYFVEF